MVQVKVRRNTQWMALLMLMLVVALAACGAGTMSASEVPADTSAATVAPTTVAEPTQPSTGEAIAEPTGEAAQAGAAEATAAPAAEGTTMIGTTVFAIDAAQSEVRFTLTELLMGDPTTVIGRGNGIEGSVSVNFDDYSQTTISPIVIDASQLVTDNNMRNGQIRRAILQTNNAEFQYITFTPTAVDGLPTGASVGQPFSFTVTGDLTIRTITQPLTFEVEVTPVSEMEIQGSARATLLRSDFDLQIPSVPSVADVSEEVLLEFDFVALAQ